MTWAFPLLPIVMEWMFWLSPVWTILKVRSFIHEPAITTSTDFPCHFSYMLWFLLSVLPIADVSLKLSGEKIRYTVESRDKACNRLMTVWMAVSVYFPVVVLSSWCSHLDSSLCMAGVQLCGEFLLCDLCWPVFGDFVELPALKSFCQYLKILLDILIDHYGGLIEIGTHRVWHY